MKAVIRGHEVECTVEEFWSLLGPAVMPKRSPARKAHRRKAQGRHIWTMAMEKQLIELNKQGVKIKEIARLIGVTTKAAHCRLHIVRKKTLREKVD